MKMNYRKIRKYMEIYCIGITLVCFFVCFLYFQKKNVKCEEKEFSLTQLSPNYVFVGDSLIAGYDITKAFPNIKLVNSGHGRDKTTDILDNLYERVYRYNPSDVILLIGTNDIYDANIKKEEIVTNIKKIIDSMKSEIPNANLYIQSIYPSRESWGKTDDNSERQEVNSLIREYCEEKNVTYVDMYSVLQEDGSNKIKEEYVTDGLHLNESGYEVVTETLKKYLNLKD